MADPYAYEPIPNFVPGLLDPKDAVTPIPNSTSSDISVLKTIPAQPLSAKQPSMRGSPVVNDAIDQAAARYGINPAVLKGIAQIESSWDPSSNSKNPKTQYKGLFQLGTSEWNQHKGGGNDVYNPYQNANAAASLLDSHAKWFENRYGRPPDASELYMMHQQGRGFFTKGTMTNIANNAYPGMRGPQTPESFQQGWGARLERAMAPYGGGGPVASAGMTAPPSGNILPGVEGLMGTAPPSGVLGTPAIPGIAGAKEGPVPAPPTPGAPGVMTASSQPGDEDKIAAAKAALAAQQDKETEKNSSKMMAMANQLMSASAAPKANFMQLQAMNTGPFRPLQIALPQMPKGLFGGS